MTTIKDPDQARSEIYKAFSDAWVAAGESMEFVQYQDQPRRGTFPPERPCPWVRLTVEHVRDRRISISNNKRRFRRYGVVTAQLFCPAGTAMQSLDRLGKVLHDAIEGVTTEPGRVYFYNTSTREIGTDGVYNQKNTVSDFYYDEVK